jgi:hypothetical protein
MAWARSLRDTCYFCGHLGLPIAAFAVSFRDDQKGWLPGLSRYRESPASTKQDAVFGTIAGYRQGQLIL